MNTALLSIYLNDHLAGATGARELARRTASSNRETGYGAPLGQLAEEIDQDRATLIAFMRSLSVSTDQLKVAAGWAAEKAGRLKANGRLLGYSPLSRVIEIEGLLLGVRGKLALWRSLEKLSEHDPRLAPPALPELLERAQRQLEGLEELRLRAAEEALL